MLHFTGHLQRAQLKTEMQNINNYGILYSLHNIIIRALLKKICGEFLGFRWCLMLTNF